MQIIEFCHIKNKFGNKSLNHVGGKNASLGKMISDMEQLGIKVPNGFAITTDFYHTFIDDNHITSLIQELDNMTEDFEEISKQIRYKIDNGNFNDEFLSNLRDHYHNLFRITKFSSTL